MLVVVFFEATVADFWNGVLSRCGFAGCGRRISDNQVHRGMGGRFAKASAPEHLTNVNKLDLYRCCTLSSVSGKERGWCVQTGKEPFPFHVTSALCRAVPAGVQHRMKSPLQQCGGKVPPISQLQPLFTML